MEVPLGDLRGYVKTRACTTLPVSSRSIADTTVRRFGWIAISSSSKVQGSGWTRNDFGPAQRDYSDSRDPGPDWPLLRLAT